MELVYFILLGIVQGLTEFLPVSSSGHLVLLDKLFNVETGNFIFVSILLHVATLFSVVILYRKQLFNLIRHPFQKYNYCIIVSTFFTGVVFLAFKSFFEQSFQGTLLPVCFMTTAIFLVILYFKTQNKKLAYLSLTYPKASAIGLMQGVAVLPGISRSGSTIFAGVMLGLDSESATEYSFMLSIPIILLSLIYEIYQCTQQSVVLYSGSVVNMIIAFLLAFIFGILAIKLMKKFAKTKRYYIFSIYLAILAILVCFI